MTNIPNQKIEERKVHESWNKEKKRIIQNTAKHLDLGCSKEHSETLIWMLWDVLRTLQNTYLKTHK